MQTWFQEEIDPDIRCAFRVESVLFRGKSEFQTVDVIETSAYGRMMLIDGLVMVTDKDEFVYHEMIAHIPALLHDKAKRAVVIGGGDGGTVRELLKHPNLEEIVLCEIDALVIEAARKYFPKIASGLDDPRVKVVVGDGVEYMKNHAPGTLDLVLVDSTDPISVGEGLFSGEFYQNVAKALKPDGLMACQSECPWYDAPALQRITNNIQKGFKYFKPYIAPIPTYPRGYWSWTLGSNRAVDPKEYNRERFEQLKDGLEYLSEDMLTGVFALPAFYKRKLGIK